MSKKGSYYRIEKQILSEPVIQELRRIEDIACETSLSRQIIAPIVNSVAL